MAKKALKIITKTGEKFLEKYLNNASPTGFEKEGQKLWMDYVKPYADEIHTDNYGSAYAVINPKAPFKVVIEAHCDEISWFVNYISSDGFIYVSRNGGSDHQIAPSKRVNIHTKKGIVKAIFGWPAIHTRNGQQKEDAPTTKNIFLDCGCNSKEEVEKLGIHPGCVITYEDEYMLLNKKYYVGRALDNRVGGFMIAEVARLLKERKQELPFGLYITNSVQEEIGLRGAQMVTDTIKPDVAIITDVCHDTSTPMINKVLEGDTKMEKGPVLTIGPAVHNNLLELITKAAEANNLDFQWAAASRSTGTDTDAFAYSNGGVPSALISLPMRYMHTTVETVAKKDVETVIELIYQSLLQIDPKKSLKYHA